MKLLAQPVETDPQLTDPCAIALCLSGGGLRATLFHLGVIKALRQSMLNGKMALIAVKEIYAVSGGSILAAHFLVNYARYIDPDPDQFKQIEKELLAFANRDIRNRILRRWPFAFMRKNARGHFLQKEYHRLLSGKTFAECYSVSDDMPTFHFLATSFTDGALCSFSRSCFERVDKYDRSRRELVTTQTAADGIPLAFAVAASSAFPPMFPPMLLTPEQLGTDGAPPFNAPIELSDGGVFDNFGIDKFCMAQRTGKQPGMLIVSNAGGSFATEPGHNYGSMFSRNIRASDILMRRVADSTLDLGTSLVGDDLILVRIGATLPDPDITETSQQRFRLIRTDLDAFDQGIANHLIAHGERIAHRAFDKHKQNKQGQRAITREDLPQKSQHAPTFSETQKIDAMLSSAAHRSWSKLFFDFKDFFILIVWWLFAALLAFGISFLIYNSYHAEKVKIAAERAAEKTKADDYNFIKTQLDTVRQAAITGDLANIRRTLAIAIQTSEERSVAEKQNNNAAPPAINKSQVDASINTQVHFPLNTLYPQRVYIQFAGNLTRAQIVALNTALKKAGWKVQDASGERTPKSAGVNEVRYGEQNQQAAQALADNLNQAGLGLPLVSVRYNKSIGNNLEIWISN